jgi:predicted CopG family antitoxin
MILMTTITVSKETRDKLASIGTKDASFEDIILELLAKWRENH